MYQPTVSLTEASLLRALLFMAGALNAHSDSGLMNRTRPDAELSTLERKILHMIGLRTTNLTWPDYDIGLGPASVVPRGYGQTR